MADDSSGAQQPGFLARLWQALFAPLVHFFSRIFRPSDEPGQQHSTEQAAPKHPISSQPAVPSSQLPNDEEAALVGTTAHTQHKGSIKEDSQDGSPEDEAGQDFASPDDDDDDDDMYAAKRGGRGGGQRSGRRSYRSQGAQHSARETASKANTSSSADVSPAAGASGGTHPNVRVVPISPAPATHQGSTNGAVDSGDGKGKAPGPPAPAATVAVPQVKLPLATVTESTNTKDSVNPNSAKISNQKENEQPGNTGAPSDGPSGAAAADKSQQGLVPAAEKPAASPSPAISQETHNGGVGPAATDKPVVVPTPIVVPLPYTMKPIPPKLLGSDMPGQILPGLVEPKTPEERKEREYHLKYMRAALDMGQLALETNETPVGCVLVWRDKIIAKGMNATNVTRNGTRHAEFMALSALLSRKEKDDIEDAHAEVDLNESTWGDVDPKDGHIFPYGQKLHPAPVVNRSIINECILYVTVEPCIMCASLLRQLGIKKVYFGAVNDKFGGTGGVFRIHMNSKPVPRPTDRPYQNGYGPAPIEKMPRSKTESTPREDDDGDGGNVEPGFPAEGGYLRDEAVSLLRRFYVQENGRAPQPRKKEGRAARLFAMEAEAQALKSSASDMSDSATAPQTPMETDAKEFLQTNVAVK